MCVSGIQEATECTKCKNDWALRAAISLLYVLCALLTVAVAVLGYKGNVKQTKKKAIFFQAIYFFVTAAYVHVPNLKSGL